VNNDAKAPGEDGEHLTYCRICEALCGMKVTVEGGRVVKAEADKRNISSKGFICTKGPNMVSVVNDPERIVYPMKRSGGPGEFTRVGWEEAMEDICSRLKAVHTAHGGESIGAYVGNPMAFAGNNYGMVISFLNSLGSTQNYTPSAADISAVCFATETILGPGFPIPDLPHCDYLMIIGANPLESHASLLHAPTVREDLDAIAMRGSVVVVDPRRTKTAKRYHHQQILPNTDIYFLMGVLNTVFDEVLTDQTFINENVVGTEKLRTLLKEFPIEDCSAQCGIAVEDIQQIARDFATHKRAACYSRLGTSRASYGALTNFLIMALNVVTGHFGVEGGSIMGVNPYLPEGFTNRGNPNSHGMQRTRTGDLPGVGGHLPCTVLADEILSDHDDRIRALIVSAGNPVLSFPNGSHLEEALAALDLMVGIDLYINESNQHADYILPATSFFEREDLPVFSISTMPRPAMHYTDSVIKPMGEAREEQHIFMDIASRLGLPNPVAMTFLPEEMWDEHNESDMITVLDVVIRNGMVGDHYGKEPEGLSLEKIRQYPHGIEITGIDVYNEWRRHARHPEGKLVLWDETIAGEFKRLALDGLKLKPKSGQLSLFGRRSVKNINSWMHNVDSLVKGAPPALLINPEDASARGIVDGQQVTIRGKYREAQCPAKVTKDVIKGSVCYPHGWGHNGKANWSRANQTEGININDLLSSDVEDVDVLTGSPLLDGYPVFVEGVG
jgi:anaerobic selenocysteine-containing dehydrogenase